MEDLIVNEEYLEKRRAEIAEARDILRDDVSLMAAEGRFNKLEEEVMAGKTVDIQDFEQFYRPLIECAQRRAEEYKNSRIIHKPRVEK